MDKIDNKIDFRECFSITTSNSTNNEHLCSRIINKDLMIPKEIVKSFDLFNSKSIFIEKYFINSELLLKRIDSIFEGKDNIGSIKLTDYSELLTAFFQSNVARQLFNDIGETNFQNIIEKIHIRKFSRNSTIYTLSKNKKMMR